MIKRSFIFILSLAILLTSCLGHNKTGYQKYNYEFLGVFDTVIQIVGYAKTPQEFDNMTQTAQSSFFTLNKLFDIYNNYENVNNIKTINDNAGITPITVDSIIIDLINFSKEWYQKSNGKCNIAIGSVLSIWHDYREAGLNNPEKAEIPSVDELKNAFKYTDINNVIVDSDKSTVFLKDKNMRLDVGAVAKGYACEIVARELRQKGFTSFIISSGGNVKAIASPLDGVRKKWGIGIQNPDSNPLNSIEEPIDTIFINDQSVVTSGDYQRYYTVYGKTYHHLIDPETLMPADYFRSVTIIANDSGVADFMSTTLFLTPYEEGIKLAEKLGIDAIWIMKDGSIKTTENIKKYMKNIGGATSK